QLTGDGGVAALSAVDSAGNAYKRIGPDLDGSGVLAGIHAELWYANGTSPGTGLAVTWTLDGGPEVAPYSSCTELSGAIELEFFSAGPVTADASKLATFFSVGTVLPQELAFVATAWYEG